MKLKSKALRAKAKRPRRIEKFSVSPLFVLLCLIMAYRGAFYEFVAYTAAVVLHELAHAEVSQRLGYTLSSLRLAPYGAALTGNYEGLKPQDEVLIAVAGPLFNILLAIPAIALWWILPESYYVSLVFVNANLIIAVFNVMPIFPLDGGRVLLGLLSQKMPRERAYKKVRVTGFLFSAVLAALFVLTFFYKINLSLGIAAVFMFLSTLIPDKNSYYERLYSMAFRTERLKNGLAVKEIMVSSSTAVLKLTKLLNGAYFTRFIVVDENFNQLFCVTETELEEISIKSNPKDSIIAAAKKSRFRALNSNAQP